MSETTIRRVLARPIFDGCARPSFEVLVETAGATAVAAPSYSDPRSSGKYEINHLPSGGVAGSIDLINTGINNLLNGSDAADQRGMATIGAARTYDSPDDTLADLVVGWGHTGYKCGAPAGGEHAAKYNRFIRIEEELRENGGALAEYPGIRP